MNGDFMLWYDGSKEPLEEKIQKAVEYYQAKYGSAPKRVEVNPQEMHPGLIRHNNAIIRPNVLVVPGYLFVGMESK